MEEPSSYMNSPISVSDAAAMYRKRVTPNMPPYDAEIIKRNNSLVDEWENNVLVRQADRGGKVPCSKVHFSWMVFFEGRELWSREQYVNHILPSVPLELTLFWLKFLNDSTIEQLHRSGINVIGYAWTIVTTSIREYFIREKWNKIYSHSNDPNEWLKLANKHAQLIKGQPMPFGLTEDKYKEMLEKYNSMMKNQVQPM